MIYEITITKREENPKKNPEVKYYGDREPDFITTKELHTVLTETEFQAMKKACLEVM